MFFPERIHISAGDSVLEVGPGATPHLRSQVFLEKRFEGAEAVRQRGGLPAIKLNRPLIYYDGGRFPFRDREFEYVICSHVLEHVDDVGTFVGELMRVAARGYVEFPTIYYEYLYNFGEHVNLVAYKDGEILWMPKRETTLGDFGPIQQFLRMTLERGYDEVIQAMKANFFQGFEWDAQIRTRQTDDIRELVPSWLEVPEPVKRTAQLSRCAPVRELWRKVLRQIEKFK
jgi:methyltransferase family protein